MYDFLQQFFKAHTKYASLPFFVFGESYAGHYVPATTHVINQNNKNLPAGAIKLNLKGTAIGNGRSTTLRILLSVCLSVCLSVVVGVGVGVGGTAEVFGSRR